MSEEEKDVEIARLRTRCALLESLLGEGIRHHYFNEAVCSASWLLEANQAVAFSAGSPPAKPGSETSIERN